MDVCIIREPSSLFFAPYALDMAMPDPIDNPIKKLTMSVTRLAVEPTAENSVCPTNVPTTIMSAVLNKSCNTPVAISGTANFKIFGNSLPRVMSISRVFDEIFKPFIS